MTLRLYDTKSRGLKEVASHNGATSMYCCGPTVYRRHMPSELESTFASLIGKRVSIRLHDPEGGFRDIVGYLQSPTTLRNRHEELIEFSHSEIFIWREVIAKK